MQGYVQQDQDTTKRCTPLTGIKLNAKFEAGSLIGSIAHAE
jgi:hypothetical protein